MECADLKLLIYLVLLFYSDYVKGLLSPAICLLVFFFAWGLLLLTFKLMAPACGSNSFRWLGGKPLRLPSPPQNNVRNDWHYKRDDDEFLDWKAEYKEVSYQHFVCKAIVWFAGLSIIIAALLMSVYGVDSLTNTLEAGRDSIDILRTLSSEAQAIVDSVIIQNDDISKEVYGMLEEINGLCPSMSDPLCDDIANISTCNISFVGDDFKDSFETVAGHFVGGEDSEYFRDMIDSKEEMEDVQNASNDIDGSTSHLNWALSLSMSMSLLLAMLCILILCGVICPEVPRVLHLIRSKVMIPTFVVLVIFAYFFSLVFVTASIATADMCVYNNATDNIDERLTAVLATSENIEEFLGGKENQNMVIDFINFYLHQCAEETLPSEILQQLNYLQVGAPLIEDFGSVLENSSESLQELCGFGTSQTLDLVSVTDNLQDQLCSLVVILTDVRDFVQCENWYPLYEQTVHEGLCYDGTKGFAYVATTQFVIVFMSFVILTFRVAFSEIQIGDEFFDEWVDDDRSSYASSDYGGRSDRRDEESDKKSGFFGGLRNKFGFSRSSPPSPQFSYSERSRSEWMEDTTSSRHERQQQEQSDWHNSPVATRSPTSSSTTARNSVYPSRRFHAGENTVVSPTRIAAAAKTRAAPQHEGNGVKVKGTIPSKVVAAKSPDQKSTKKQREESGSPTSIMCGLGSFRSPFADSTSLWTKNWNNIDYVDSEDESNDHSNGRDPYNYGDDVSSVSGGNNTSGKEWWT